MDAFVNRLRTALQESLPGEVAQYKMAPQHRARQLTGDEESGKYRPSAVMILLCTDKNDELFIPLIERMPYEGAHSAQISLPGGKYEQGDANLYVTARRECFEEIGIDEISYLGKLTPLHIPVSSFLVHPFIGHCKVKDPLLVPHTREVRSVLKFTIHHLTDESFVKNGRVKVKDSMSVESPWFDVDGHQVWGATAMILSELKEVCRPIF
jgi:8-oxo-dGTP pyrophosphatase MutT (NUDIX family)